MKCKGKAKIVHLAIHAHSSASQLKAIWEQKVTAIIFFHSPYCHCWDGIFWKHTCKVHPVIGLRSFFAKLQKNSHAWLHQACADRESNQINSFQKFAESTDRASSEQVTASFTPSTMHGEVHGILQRATASHSWRNWLVSPWLQLTVYPFVKKPSHNHCNSTRHQCGDQMRYFQVSNVLGSSSK